MKKHILKSIAIMLAVVLVLPMLSMGNVTVASAKDKKKTSPTLSVTSKTLTEDGETFTVSIKDAGSNVKTINWYSQNTKVATVKSTNDPYTVTVTSVRKGTTHIKSKITYSDGRVVTPSVKVTVKVKATAINISNEKLVNGVHVIEIGKKYNFNVKLTPRNAQYKTYWFISDDDIASVDSKGFVKGLEEGTVVLTAVAAMSKEAAKTSTIKDTVTIKIVERQYDDDDDDDDDDHDVSNKPEYKSYSIDPSGLIVTFNFSEAMNFTNLVVSDVKATVSGQTLQATTLGLLQTKSNYVPSADKKSLTINLTNIPVEDQNKEMSVRLYGLKDLEGNVIENDPITVTFKTDTVLKPQAKIISIERVEYNKVTATFDRAIKTPGVIVVNNESFAGVINSSDLTKVNYTISAAAAQLTGYQKVYIGYWDSYNVLPNDTSADALTEKYVNFSVNNLLPLPAPVSVTQATNDNNVITVQFNHMLDETTAENKSNYTIAGVVITAAELTNTTTGGTVKLTLQPGSLQTTKTYTLTVAGVKGYNNSYREMNPYQVSLYLKENAAPELISYNYVHPNSIVLTFNETLAGTPSFTVIQNNINIGSYSYINGNTVIIILNITPEPGKSMQLFPNSSNLIQDLSGNKTTSVLSRTI